LGLVAFDSPGCLFSPIVNLMAMPFALAILMCLVLLDGQGCRFFYCSGGGQKFLFLPAIYRL